MTLIKFSPKLEKYEKLKFWINKIDKNRYYSNFGPLYKRATDEIKKDLKLKKKEVILTSSGDAALYTALLRLRKKTKKNYVILPSFSFSSDPQSIIRSNFNPYFIDIDKNSLSINIDDLKNVLRNEKNKIAAILFVSPFGKPLDIRSLNKLKKQYKVEIIYDAADAYFNFKKNLDEANFLITLSFHPTKNLPANESGCIICNKKEKKIFESIINFGHCNSGANRKINYIGFNAKFSEYDAAIFLANFFSFKKNFHNIIKKCKYFKKKFVYSNFSRVIQDFGSNWFSNKICIIYKKEKFISIKKKFKFYDIEIFSPWGLIPMHKQKIFKKFKKTNMRNTNFISKHLFAIPLNIDTSKKNLLK